MAGGSKDARDDTIGGIVEIGIGEDDVGRFAAKLKSDPLQASRTRLVDLSARGFATGERDLGDMGMLQQCRPDLGAEACHNIDHALWKTRLLEQLAESEGRCARMLGRLEHEGVAGGETRGELEGGEQER